MWSSWCFSTSVYWFIQDRSVCVAVYLLACHHVSLEYETLAISSRQNGEYISIHQHTFNFSYLPAPSSNRILTRKQTGTLLARNKYTHLIQLFFLLRADCWIRGKLPTPRGSNRFSWNIIDWQFCHLSRFSTNGISLRSGEAEMKILQRSGQAHFIRASSPDSSRRIAFAFFKICSLPLARVLPNVSLLAG